MMQDSVKIIQNAYVLTCDEAGTGGPMTVIVRNDRIAHVVPPSYAATMQYPQAEVVDATGKVLLPGFVDAHYHGESLLMHLGTAGEPSSRWPRQERFRSLGNYLRTSATSEEWLALYRGSYYAALRSGVTTLAEFGIADNDKAFSGAVEAFRRTDLRGLIAVHNGDQLELTKGVRSTGLGFMMALPGSEELTTYNLQTMLRQARDHRMPLLGHLGETVREAEVVRRNFHRSVVQVLDGFHLWTAPLIPVHCSVLEEGDVAVLKAADPVIVVTPGGAQLKGVELPPVAMLWDAGVSMALGTDWGPVRPWHSLRSLWALSAVDGRRGIPALDLLRMHTLNGARALGIASEVGSITAGKKADLVLVNAAFADLRIALEVLPPDALAEVLLHRTTAGDVADVMVNGEFYVRGGQVLTYADDDLLEDVRRLMHNAGASGTLSIVPPAPVAEPTSPATGPLEGVDEGFHVVRRRIDDTLPAPILPLPTKQESRPELPPTTRRVFGDDDE